AGCAFSAGLGVSYASSVSFLAPKEAPFMSTDAISAADSPFPVPAAPGWQALERLKFRLLDRLTGQLDLAQVRRLPEPNRRGELRLAAARFLAAEDACLPPDARDLILEAVLDELVGLGPIDTLLRDSAGGDIVINGPYEVWVERNGVLEPAEVRFRDERH